MTATTDAPRTTRQPLARSRLLGRDAVRLGSTGLRARPVRAFLSALGIAIGIAAMLAVVGISASSQAKLNTQLEALGTNLLTATPGTDLFGKETRLPTDSVGRAGQIAGVERVSSTGTVPVNVYRNQFSDPGATGGISTLAADTGLLDVVGGEIASGTWLNAATGSYPSVVLGSTAAERLGIASPGTQIRIGGQWFTVIGILKPVALAPELNTGALIGEAIAQAQFGYSGNPTTLYERSSDAAVEQVRSVLAATLDPQTPSNVQVSRPSDALAAKQIADESATRLLVGLGAIALLVGGIGVANTMIISVLERRREIGLRRALGATRGHIRLQFLAESLLLSALGGALGAVLGASVVWIVSALNGWPPTLSPVTVLLGIGATLGIGAIAGLYPAVRAARTPPSAALSS